MSEQLHQGDGPILLLQPGPANTGELEFHISPDDADDFGQFIRAAGAQPSTYADFAVGNELIVYGIPGLAALGGFSGLAKLLTAWFHRNDGKEWTFKVGDQEVSTKGSSRKDAEAWVAMFLEQQAERDSKWNAGQDPDDESS